MKKHHNTPIMKVVKIIIQKRTQKIMTNQTAVTEMTKTANHRPIRKKHKDQT